MGGGTYKKSIQFAGQLSSQNWVATGLVHGKLIIILSAWFDLFQKRLWLYSFGKSALKLL